MKIPKNKNLQLNKKNSEENTSAKINNFSNNQNEKRDLLFKINNLFKDSKKVNRIEEQFKPRINNRDDILGIYHKKINNIDPQSTRFHLKPIANKRSESVPPNKPNKPNKLNNKFPLINLKKNFSNTSNHYNSSLLKPNTRNLNYQTPIEIYKNAQNGIGNNKNSELLTQPKKSSQKGRGNSLAPLFNKSSKQNTPLPIEKKNVKNERVGKELSQSNKMLATLNLTRKFTIGNNEISSNKLKNFEQKQQALNQFSKDSIKIENLEMLTANNIGNMPPTGLIHEESISTNNTDLSPTIKKNSNTDPNIENQLIKLFRENKSPDIDDVIAAARELENNKEVKVENHKLLEKVVDSLNIIKKLFDFQKTDSGTNINDCIDRYKNNLTELTEPLKIVFEDFADKIYGQNKHYIESTITEIDKLNEEYQDKIRNVTEDLISACKIFIGIEPPDGIGDFKDRKNAADSSLLNIKKLKNVIVNNLNKIQYISELDKGKILNNIDTEIKSLRINEKAKLWEHFSDKLNLKTPSENKDKKSYKTLPTNENRKTHKISPEEQKQEIDSYIIDKITSGIIDALFTDSINPPNKINNNQFEKLFYSCNYNGFGFKHFNFTQEQTNRVKKSIKDRFISKYEAKQIDLALSMITNLHIYAGKGDKESNSKNNKEVKSGVEKILAKKEIFGIKLNTKSTVFMKNIESDLSNFLKCKDIALKLYGLVLNDKGKDYQANVTEANKVFNTLPNTIQFFDFFRKFRNDNLISIVNHKNMQVRTLEWIKSDNADFHDNSTENSREDAKKHLIDLKNFSEIENNRDTVLNTDTDIEDNDHIFLQKLSNMKKSKINEISKIVNNKFKEGLATNISAKDFLKTLYTINDFDYFEEYVKTLRGAEASNLIGSAIKRTSLAYIARLISSNEIINKQKKSFLSNCICKKDKTYSTEIFFQDLNDHFTNECDDILKTVQTDHNWCENLESLRKNLYLYQNHTFVDKEQFASLDFFCGEIKRIGKKISEFSKFKDEVKIDNFGGYYNFSPYKAPKMQLSIDTQKENYRKIIGSIFSEAVKNKTKKKLTDKDKVRIESAIDSGFDATNKSLFLMQGLFDSTTQTEFLLFLSYIKELFKEKTPFRTFIGMVESEIARFNNTKIKKEDYNILENIRTIKNRLLLSEIWKSDKEISEKRRRDNENLGKGKTDEWNLSFLEMNLSGVNFETLIYKFTSQIELKKVIKKDLRIEYLQPAKETLVEEMKADAIQFCKDHSFTGFYIDRYLKKSLITYLINKHDLTDIHPNIIADIFNNAKIKISEELPIKFSLLIDTIPLNINDIGSYKIIDKQELTLDSIIKTNPNSLIKIDLSIYIELYNKVKDVQNTAGSTYSKEYIYKEAYDLLGEIKKESIKKLGSNLIERSYKHNLFLTSDISKQVADPTSTKGYILNDEDRAAFANADLSSLTPKEKQEYRNIKKTAEFKLLKNNFIDFLEKMTEVDLDEILRSKNLSTKELKALDYQKYFLSEVLILSNSLTSVHTNISKEQIEKIKKETIVLIDNLMLKILIKKHYLFPSETVGIWGTFTANINKKVAFWKRWNGDIRANGIFFRVVSAYFGQLSRGNDTSILESYNPTLGATEPMPWEKKDADKRDEYGNKIYTKNKDGDYVDSDNNVTLKENMYEGDQDKKVGEQFVYNPTEVHDSNKFNKDKKFGYNVNNPDGSKAYSGGLSPEEIDAKEKAVSINVFFKDTFGLDLSFLGKEKYSSRIGLLVTSYVKVLQYKTEQSTLQMAGMDPNKKENKWGDLTTEQKIDRCLVALTASSNNIFSPINALKNTARHTLPVYFAGEQLKSLGEQILNISVLTKQREFLNILHIKSIKEGLLTGVGTKTLNLDWAEGKMTNLIRKKQRDLAAHSLKTLLISLASLPLTLVPGGSFIYFAFVELIEAFGAFSRFLIKSWKMVYDACVGNSTSHGENRKQASNAMAKIIFKDIENNNENGFMQMAIDTRLIQKNDPLVISWKDKCENKELEIAEKKKELELPKNKNEREVPKETKVATQNDSNLFYVSFLYKFTELLEKTMKY